ncbi:DUF421 domain-containing protein [Pueribacillus theae]|uniref:DUF421 domain-containing protein n=1 Tax=Pueribacillus theae TaxID=2171751 RepID=A0A2U1K107_9BACI|nr:DUF421 domain-containing protein [Pueribacillus theae]PWA11196.1 DUF421 domain-containing protein [Pueribacillus theae]
MDYLDTALKLIIGLAALLVVIRLLGKKEMGQFTPLDFIYALLLGSIIEESLYDKKTTILLMLFQMGIWAAAIYFVEVVIQRNEKMRNLIKGRPSIIIKNGEIHSEQMKKNHLEFEQIRQLLRQQGIFTLREVRDLYLEPGGTISVKKWSEFETLSANALGIDLDDEAPSIVLVDKGKIKEDMLQFIGKTKKWLLKNLSEEGYTNVEDIFYCEWTETDGFFIKTYKMVR